MAREDHAVSKLPVVEANLLDYVERMFPNQAPSLSDDEKTVWFKAGAASVASHLRAVHEQQNENILENY